ncbi:uncharacterized protein [Macrobrachium rosenbergii]|uniref:uncharacterized protein n=1 Tax=Macrobrachium rosenbergii TaxID=79674 RepID=UPI0034D4AB5F
MLVWGGLGLGLGGLGGFGGFGGGFGAKGSRSADRSQGWRIGLGGLGFNGGFGGGFGGKGGLLGIKNYANGFSHSKGYSHGTHIGGGFKGLGGLGTGHLKKFFLGKRSVDQEPESD